MAPNGRLIFYRGNDGMPEAAFTQETIEKLKAAMFKLRESGIEASAVVSRDGTMIASDTAPGEEHKIFAAMYAAMLGAAETATSELKLGIPRRVVLEIGKRKIIAMGAGPIAMGISVLGPKAQYSKALSEIEKAAVEVKSILASAR